MTKSKLFGRPLTKTQADVLSIIGKRFVFFWGQFYAISETDGSYRHGYYDRDRESAIARRNANVSTIRALWDKGALVQVKTFPADATGAKAYILKPSAP